MEYYNQRQSKDTPATILTKPCLTSEDNLRSLFLLYISASLFPCSISSRARDYLVLVEKPITPP